MTVKSIKIINGKILKNKKGNLIKYISKKNSFFKGFGEIYFNEIKLKKKRLEFSQKKYLFNNMPSWKG